MLRHKFRIGMIVVIALVIGAGWWWTSGIPGINDGQPGHCMNGGCFAAGVDV